ncbi:acetylglutamate synthase [Nannizzia gypsea CBS 118893]|uniref:Amino-acid acetyltransferase, mitochondrial n=1 Tax=Arthroderma gypseum (strain ATCC MYA-4604 / CBS 118893) TaxID=535722 RepID=E4V3K4_ARTGP|nr:acetylglutamate synthase [Nannizzia gypsea CBS 118893]EFR04578.1 acetylglutamate synthase [Nannizzia gypsea CBS 118893]
MGCKAALQLRLLLHQHNSFPCHSYGYLPSLKRRCLSHSTPASHPSLLHRIHAHTQYPVEIPDQLGHSAKEKEEDKEFFLDLLSTATTKREAKSYLSRFTPPQPPSISAQQKDETKANAQAPDLEKIYSEASITPSTQENLSTVYDVSKSKDTIADSLHVALVKIRSPESLDDQCLHGISKTLSQLSRLAMGCCIVLEVNNPGNDIDYRQLATAQASRVAAKIDQVHGLGSRRLESAVSLDESTHELSILSRNALLSPLSRGQIVVVDPIGYTVDTPKALPVAADELILALTKELAGPAYNSGLNEVDAKTTQKIPQRQQDISVERLIILDPLGGIPSLGRGLHKSHVFINLEQEYEDIQNEITQATTNPPNSAQDGLQTGLKGHLANLTLLQKALALLPTSSSGFITTPQDATALSLNQHDAYGAPTVGTRQRRNPLIHNLLTDKPVLSASLPARRRGGEKGDHVSSNQSSHPTFVKHGMPLIMIPDPRVKCWTAAHNEGSRINLDDPAIDLPRLVHLIDDSFSRKLDVNHYLNRVKDRLAGLIIAGEYEGGAILTWELPPGVPDDGSPESMSRMVPYLDKFAVLKRSQGAGGVADIVFNAMVRTCFPEGVCWRSRKNNPVNKWYFERSRGTWKLPDSNWAMFWTTDNVPENEQLFEDYESVCRSIQPSWADNKKEVD